MKIRYLFVVLTVVGICGLADALVYIDLPIVGDATVDSLDSTIRGDEGELMIQGFNLGPYSLNSKKRTYLMFDLTQIPDEAEITSAEFGIYFFEGNGPGGNTIDPVATLYLAEDKVNNVMWDEMSITWGNEPVNSGGSIDSDKAMPGATPKYYTWNLLSDLGDDEWSLTEQEADLQDNFISFMLATSYEGENNSAKFYSEEAAIGVQPYLNITYAIPEPLTITLLGFGGLFLRRRK